MNKVNKKLGELTHSIWVCFDNYDKELPAGSIVEILSEYQDHGDWSDGDPYHVESPYPAYHIVYGGAILSGIHTKVVELLT